MNPAVPTPAALVRLVGADIGYDGEPVVRGVDLRLDRGDVVALLGANASGKSTLVRGILGLAEVQTGELQLFGTPPDRFRQRWRIGYVPQRTGLTGAIPSTVAEVVTAGRLARLGFRRRLGPDDRAAIDVAIRTVELADHRDDPVGTLSGGQQRRVSIARALAAEPELLILDEPTAGLDAESQQRLAVTLGGLHDDGTTILLVAHELGPAAPLVSRVVVMRDGRVAFDGPPQSHHREHAHDVEDGCEHLHEHGDEPPRPGTGLMGW